MESRLIAAWRANERRNALGALGIVRLLSTTNDFDRIARFYRTDKSSRLHGYAAVYARHLGPRRFQQNVLLEIGIGIPGNRTKGGASLRAWRDYMPRSSIVGLDIEAKDLPFLGRRVHTVQGDQASPDVLGEIIDRFGVPDVVIDDGSHVGAHQIASFRYLFPRMKAGSIYAIEDLYTSFVEDLGGAADPLHGTGVSLARDWWWTRRRTTGRSTTDLMIRRHRRSSTA